MPEDRNKPKDPGATDKLSDKTGQDDDATQPLSERGGRDVATDDHATLVASDDATEDQATVRVSKRGTEDAGNDEATVAISGDRTPGGQPPDHEPAVPPPEHPKQIQHFRIIRTLGQGGMGAVYLAEQSEPVERQVALKLVHASLRGGEALARFNAERQAMARLSHPNIAALFEAGATDDGFPFFAMEIVPGDSLTKYCDKHRISLDKRLELFSQVCAGVQHAHQKGIIHRDLKPSNLLVTEVEGEPIPKVIDFGIAKALDEPLTEAAELTGHGAIGTPAYMSPEALGGSQDLDTRTDVYSLGMVLYELLSGLRPRNPVKKASGGVIADWKPPTRASGELAKASTAELEELARRRQLSGAELGSRISGDLDWIMMKAVAEEPDRRYESAAEFAADIERHLAFEPVLARPPSAAYRTGRFVRRHRIAVTGGALVMLALVLGIVGTSTGLVRARQAEGEARLEAQRAEEVAGFLTELFAVSDPGTARGNEVTARELLDRGARRISNELADQPRLQARLMGTMTDVYGNLGLYDQAVELEEQALAVRETLLGDQHPDVAASLTTLGDLYRQQARYADAKALLQRAIGIYKEEGHPGLAKSLNALATVEAMLGNHNIAETLYQEVIGMREGAPDTKPLELAASLHSLGWLLGNQQRYPEAETRLLRALEIREQVLGEDHFKVADNLGLLATFYTWEGRFDEAEELMLRALAIKQRVLEPDHPEIAEGFLALGTLYRFQGRKEEAESHLRSALGVFETALGPDHLDVARTLDELGLILWNAGRWQEAERVYRRQLDIFRKQLGDEHQFVGQSLNSLGSVLGHGLNRYREGEEVLLRSVALFDASAEPDDYWKALSRWSLANNLREQHRHGDAEPWYEQAVDLLVATGGPGYVDNPDLDQLIADYALMLRADNREEEATELETRFEETGG